MKKTMWIGVLSFLISGCLTEEKLRQQKKACGQGFSRGEVIQECERLKP